MKGLSSGRLVEGGTWYFVMTSMSYIFEILVSLILEPHLGKVWAQYPQTGT